MRVLRNKCFELVFGSLESIGFLCVWNHERKRQCRGRINTHPSLPERLPEKPAFRSRLPQIL